MKQFSTILKLSCAIAVTCLVTSVRAQNIVADPGFEASADSTFGNPFSPSWTLVDPSGNSDVGGNASFAHGGNNYANLGTAFTTDPSTGSSTGTLTQTLTTVAGGKYNLSFWLANNVPASSAPGNFFQVLFGSTLVFATPVMSPPFPADGLYHLFQFSNLAATGTSTTLQFQFRNDLDFWRLDDISASLPEGGAPLWIAIPLLGGLCLLHSRFSRSRKTVNS